MHYAGCPCDGHSNDRYDYHYRNEMCCRNNILHDFNFSPLILLLLPICIYDSQSPAPLTSQMTNSPKLIVIAVHQLLRKPAETFVCIHQWIKIGKGSNKCDTKARLGSSRQRGWKNCRISNVISELTLATQRWSGQCCNAFTEISWNRTSITENGQVSLPMFLFFSLLLVSFLVFLSFLLNTIYLCVGFVFCSFPCVFSLRRSFSCRCCKPTHQIQIGLDVLFVCAHISTVHQFDAFSTSLSFTRSALFLLYRFFYWK